MKPGLVETRWVYSCLLVLPVAMLPRGIGEHETVRERKRPTHADFAILTRHASTSTRYASFGLVLLADEAFCGFLRR